MADSWSVPIVPGVFTDLNETIAKGPDLSWIKTLADNYFKGKEQRYVQDQRDLFKNGIPADMGTLIQNYAKTMGASALPQIMQLEQLKYGQQVNQNAFPTGAPSTGLPPSSATAIPSNNPGNIENGPFAQRQAGYVPSPGRFARFASDEAGTNAAGNLLGVYGQKGVVTPNAIAARWAPAGDGQNNPAQYGAFIAKQLGVSPDQPLDLNDPNIRTQVVQAIRRFEGNDRARPPGPTTAPPAGLAGPSQQTVDPSAGGLVPDKWVQQYGQQAPAQYLNYLKSVNNGMLPKETADAIQGTIKSLQEVITKGLEQSPGMKDYATAVRQGFRGTQQEFEALKAETEATAKERGKQTLAGVEPATKLAIERLGKSQDKAESAKQDIEISHDLLDQLNTKSGIFTGQFAPQQLVATKFGQLLGLSSAELDRAVTNTEAFSAVVGQKVARLVKSFGSGTSITNQDREYAQKMAAGDISLNEQSIRRVLEITEKINRSEIDRHNKQVNSLLGSRPEVSSFKDTFTVTQPGQYEPVARPTQNYQSPSQTGTANAAQTFQKGQTATNPRTGEKILFNGLQWVPAQGM